MIILQRLNLVLTWKVLENSFTVKNLIIEGLNNSKRLKDIASVIPMFDYDEYYVH